jgi:aryl-alcohol dehydrogenase-like predicted oxidoreductase
MSSTMSEAFAELKQKADENGLETMFDGLVEQFKQEDKYHDMFDARLMQARNKLGLPIILANALDDLPDDQQVIELLETAREIGVTLIDTAPAYGISESRLGSLLPGKRDDWLICTKAGETYENGKSKFDFTARGITESVTRSLANLKTDYLDIVLIHSNGDDLNILNHTDAMSTLLDLKAQGAVRLVGMSTKTVEGGLRALAFSDVLMVTFNLDDRSEKRVISEAHSAGKGILVKKALASGHADPQESLRFVLSEPGVSSVVLGTINPEHLRQNVAVAMND